MKVRWLSGTILALAMIAVACGGTKPEDTPQNAEPIVIGTVAPFVSDAFLLLFRLAKSHLSESLPHTSLGRLPIYDAPEVTS